MAIPKNADPVAGDSQNPPLSAALGPLTSHDSTTLNPKEAITKITDLKNEIGASFVADSHDLAHQEHEDKGEAQQPAITEVRDLGWHQKLPEMPGTLIGGVRNEDLFAMIRRFNKDVFDVQAMPAGASRGLDLTETWSDENASAKGVLHLERAYLSIVLGLTSFGKHVSRLRSWKETRRTGEFCMAYTLAWSLDLLVPLVLGTLVVIIASEQARDALFPPAPIALVNMSTGGLQEAPAGQLGTTDTITGAPEKATGEAKDEEASSFVTNIRHLMARTSGMHDNNDEEGKPLQGKVPEPIQNGLKAMKEAGTAPGHATEKSGENMTKEPMENLMWGKIQPRFVEPVVKAAPHVLGEVVDNWERFANVVTPTPPFSHLSFRRIEAVLLPLFLISLFVPQYLVYKGTGFAIGLGIFGEPILSQGLAMLNEKIPNWVQMLDPKNNIFRGVPTNSQITLTLLRIGEANRSPLPPVPITKPTDSNELPDVDVDKVPLNASPDSVAKAIEPTPEQRDLQGKFVTSGMDEADDEKGETVKHPHLAKFMGVFKTGSKATVKGMVKTELAADHIRAAAGSEKARGYLGVLQNATNLIYAGPAEFKARFGGKKGWLYISNPMIPETSSSISRARLLFVSEDHRGGEGTFNQADESQIQWSILQKDIRRLKRTAAFSNKPAEKAAEWSKDTELLGSLEIVDQEDKSWWFTAIPERDELFNRLIALGDQRWQNN